MKTLHPAIHGGLLANRADATHVEELAKHAIEPIDLVISNLYPFEKVRGSTGLWLLHSALSLFFSPPPHFPSLILAFPIVDHVDGGLWPGI